MSDNSAPSMDYPEHERTYAAFINFSKVGTVTILTVVICLILFGFGGTAATIFGWLILIAAVIAGAIGLAIGDKGWVPPVAVFVLSIILAILTV